MTRADELEAKYAATSATYDAALAVYDTAGDAAWDALDACVAAKMAYEKELENDKA